MPLLSNVGNKVYLKLNHGYEFPGRFNKNYFNNDVEIFAFLKKKTYELELIIAWKIHPVIFVAQLEPLFPGENLYGRPKFNHPPIIETKNDTPAYEIEKLVNTRTRKYNKIKNV